MGKIDFDKFIVDWLESKYAPEQNRVADALKKQGLKIVNGAIMPIEDKKEPKFKVGDKIRRKTPRRYDKDMQVARVESNHYICNHIGQFSSESIPFSEESNYELVKQSPADKIESKFKVGDWVTNGIGFTFQVRSIEDNMYLRSDDYFIDIETADKIFRLWTIQDAKAGDVLAAHECYVIFKEIDGLNIKCYCTYHYMGSNPSLYVDTLQNKTAFYPATQEQRDTLMKAMAGAGYTFDFEKKELKKIEQKPEETPIISLKDFQEAFELKARQYDIELPNRGYDIHAMCKELYSLLIKQKPAWSEEDEKKITYLDDLVGYQSCLSSDEKKDFHRWFKSLKERFAWKPSDGQIYWLKDAMDSTSCKPSKQNLESLYDDLKKLM